MLTRPIWLLDKNVVRRGAESLAASLILEPLTEEQQIALQLLITGHQFGVRMAITPETANILLRRRQQLPVRLFNRFVEEMQQGRYFRRWTRRIREYGFTQEDAKVLSYGTYGLNPTGLGATAVITFDRPFINHFERHRQRLSRRLRYMTAQLQAPYNEATLPEMQTPEQALQH